MDAGCKVSTLNDSSAHCSERFPVVFYERNHLFVFAEKSFVDSFFSAALLKIGYCCLDDLRNTRLTPLVALQARLRTVFADLKYEK